MLEIYQTPVDVLYFVLTICIGVLSFFLLIVLLHLIGFFSNLRHITSKAKDTVDLVNHYLWQPIKIMMTLVEKGKEYTAKRKKKED